MLPISRPVAEWLTRPRTALLIWGSYAFLSINQSIIWGVVAHRDRPWYAPIPWVLTTAVLWACFTAPIVRFARWKRLDRAEWKANLPWHIGAILACALIDAGADQGVRVLTGMPFAYWGDFFRKLDVITFCYAVICGAAHAADYHEMYRAGQLRAVELESELRTSQLEHLKSQLQPHFLFNTLNAVNALIYEDARAADRVVTRLGELLRMTLAVGSAQETSLAHELEFIRAYLDIQQTRMGQRLRVSWQIPDATLNARVPTLMLQPLVENAIIHGIAPVVRGGELTIQSAVQDGKLTLRVTDTGQGIPPVIRYGIGLSNVQQRLARLYGDAHEFSIRHGVERGTIVEILLPYDVANAAADTLAAAS